MNYPLWDVPATGLIIAFVAVVHVFISHFAVGGGLFLVLTERKARRDDDAELLAFVRRHSRFFVLLTLVGGAITGVGIWFTIGLVYPQATATLIQAFVWGWAIEWTFFVVEIAAAMVYYYGWDRLDARTHLTIGWIYFGAAWLSLAVINGILTFMLTPGAWVVTHSFWDGILNPTYLPGVVARTVGAFGLAGLYALVTAAWMEQGALKQRIARYAGLAWVVPAGAVLPLTVAWYLVAAAGAGVPVAEILGAPGGTLRELAAATLTGAATIGVPIAQRAAAVALLSWVVVLMAMLVIVRWRAVSFGRPAAVLLMACGLAGIGAMEWVREDLRKPYIIGQVMYVNGVWADEAEQIRTRGVIPSALWARKLPSRTDPVEAHQDAGAEIFRLQCSSCHTVNGYLAIEPLVRNTSVTALQGTIRRLDSWRHRRMPPFTGTDDDRQALATYLAGIGGASPEQIRLAAAQADVGHRLFDENCAMCHGPDGDVPFKAAHRSAEQLYELIGRLPSIDDAMPAFEGSDQERQAIADYIATLDVPQQSRIGGGR